MRENIAKIEYDPKDNIIRCGSLFTHEYYMKGIDWEYLALRCGVVMFNPSWVKRKRGGEPVWVKKGKNCGTREGHLELSEMLGMPAKRYAKILKGVQYSVWIKGKEDLISNLCFGFGGKWSSGKITLMNQYYDLLRSYQYDNLSNLLPIAFYTGKTTKELKKMFGKKLWKRLCQNTFSRNKLIFSCIGFLENYTDWEENPRTEQYVELVKIYNTYPSTIFRSNKAISHKKDFSWAVSILKSERKLGLKNGVRRYKDTYKDTKRMAERLGEVFNPSWSFRTMEEKHKEFTKRIEQERYPDTFIECLEKISLKKYTDGKYVANLLTTPLQIKIQGDTQRHCVASYIDSVRAGSYLVYDIKEKGEIVSTLGLTKNAMFLASDSKKPKEEKWRFNQHYGPCNSQVPEDLELFADKLIKELNNA